MDAKTAVIDMGGQRKAQVQLVETENGGKTAHLYAANGVFLLGCSYEGDDDTGFSVGRALYQGYIAGWDNCQYSLGKAVTKALYEPHGDL